MAKSKGECIGEWLGALGFEVRGKDEKCALSVDTVLSLMNDAFPDIAEELKGSASNGDAVGRLRLLTLYYGADFVDQHTASATSEDELKISLSGLVLGAVVQSDTRERFVGAVTSLSSDSQAILMTLIREIMHEENETLSSIGSEVRSPASVATPKSTHSASRLSLSTPDLGSCDADATPEAKVIARRLQRRTWRCERKTSGCRGSSSGAARISREQELHPKKPLKRSTAVSMKPWLQREKVSWKINALKWMR